MNEGIIEKLTKVLPASELPEDIMNHYYSRRMPTIPEDVHPICKTLLRNSTYGAIGGIKEFLPDYYKDMLNGVRPDNTILNIIFTNIRLYKISFKLTLITYETPISEIKELSKELDKMQNDNVDNELLYNKIKAMSTILECILQCRIYTQTKEEE